MDRAVYQRLNEIENEHWWFKSRRRILSSLIKQYSTSPTALKILEVGCGTGGNLEMLSLFGNVSAFEMDEEARTIASKKSSLLVKDGQLPDRIPFDTKSFDLIAALDVLEHVEDDNRSLENISKFLTDKGRLLITVPALPWLWSEHDVRHHHFRRYSKAELAGKLQKAGFKLVYISYFNSFLLPLIIFVRVAKKITGQTAHNEDAMPSPAVNKILSSIFSAERTFLGKIKMPLGVSLVAIAERA